MKVRIKLFAIVKERAGAGEFFVDLPEGATVAAVADALRRQYPATADFLGRSAFALNREYVDAATPVRDGDEVAVIPPVSGG